MSLDAFLSALSGRRQFINYRLEPKEGGGTNKLPTCPLTGRNIDSQDPRNWMTPEEARSTGLPVAIVIYEGCGIACIDLDHCIVDGAWTPFAQDIMGRFPQAAKEISQSMTGAHIFVRAVCVPEHRTRRAGIPMEIYTRARFIALTENGFVGSPLIDYTGELTALIAEFYPEAIDRTPQNWTTEAYEGWRGDGTDEQIIYSQLHKKASPRALFGDGCTFKQLWEADADALGRAFPPEKPGQSWNASSADQALANHLAYATGYNCERVSRMMLDYDCALKREKWNREDYMFKTVTRACERREAAELAANAHKGVESVSQPPRLPLAAVAPPVTSPPALAGAASPSSAPTSDDNQTAALITSADVGAVHDDPETVRKTFKPGALLTASEQQRLFEGMIWVSDVNEISYPNGLMKDQSRLNSDLGGFVYLISADGKSTKKAWEAFTESELTEFPRVEAMTFDPSLPPRFVLIRDGHRVLNSYVPVHVDAIPGDVSLFLNHLHKLYPNERDAAILLAYFAAMVQHKGTKFQWAPLLQGVEGNGKTFFSRAMTYCLSKRYTHNARASEIGSNFNGAFEDKLLVIIEDVKISEHREAAWETLKPMITNTTMEIERKGVNQVTRDVCFNFIMNSNHKDAIRKTENDRRIANFFSAQQRKFDLARDNMGPGYFKRLYDWADEGGYAAIHHYLLNYAIPDELNPATGCTVAPDTSSTDAALTASAGTVEQELAEAIAQERRGFAGGWISSEAFGALLANLHMSKKITRYRRHEILIDHGYTFHPALVEGRMRHALADGSRPQLYVAPGHSSILLTDPKAIAAAFNEAQVAK